MTETCNQAITAISNRILMLQKANLVYSMSRLSQANVCPPPQVFKIALKSTLEATILEMSLESI